MEKIKNQTKKYVRVKCHKCENKQLVFGNSKTKVECLKCGEVLAYPRGGKASIQTEIIELV